MAAPIKKHVRLRIYFENADIQPSWLLVELSLVENIKSLKKRICKRFLKHHHKLELTLQDCVLPGIESSIILHDDDAIHVRICSNSTEDTDDRQDKQKTAELVQDDIHAGETPQNPDDDELLNRDKKVKKRKHKSIEVSSNDDRHASCHGKKKKKKKDTELEDEPDQHNYNSFSLKRVKLSAVDVEDIGSVKPDHVMPVMQTSKMPILQEAVVESPSAGQFESNDNTMSKNKTKRKRRRKRKNNDNKSQTEACADGLQGVDINCSSKETVISTSRVRNDPKNKIKGCKQKSVNNHTLFSSSDASDMEDKTAQEADSKVELYPRSEARTTEVSVKNSVDNDQASCLETMKKKLLSRVQELECRVNNDRNSSSSEFENKVTGSVEDSSYAGSKQTDTCVQHTHGEMTPTSMENDVFRNLTPEQDILNDTSKSEVISTVKSSVLPNGVPVYSRQRPSGKWSNSQRFELTKQQQLNTKLTNKSILLKQENGDIEDIHDSKILKTTKQSTEESQSTNKEDCIAEYVGRDYSRFPQLQGTPRSGDSIAYKILEMSETYTPEISEFKEGVVLEFDHTAQMVKIQVKQGNSARKTTGKFDLTLEDDDVMLTNVQTVEDKVTLPWSSIFDARLLM